MDQNTRTENLKKRLHITPYSQYQNTEEWVIIAHLLKELEDNQDIELKTAPEYVVGYLVEKLRNKDLFKEQEQITNRNNHSRQLRKEI
ncbi:MAG: hypothetical protein I3273_06945 [Candidatus Moeniiplasma glomeromycotorum]|nr:hypothetical protein [Candidatus Moeniiplasma glomeromycotorum]MCE8168269.1 hypothetical protein [Candidatus Moeniiplasma glomeromycotorum]MCE8169823.1 hypothetical protein [Candidatus Moeniiplasma glomeromycotorum]